MSVEYAAEYTEKYESQLLDKLLLYLMHGWLHLAGINDKTEDETKNMDKEEKKFKIFYKNIK
jgi:ssRNA-specific RNase YbeY (16S rRNA maturation enzyme)